MSGVLRNLARTVPQIAKQTQKANYVIGPPKNPLPFPKMVAIGSLVLVSIWGPGIYLLSNLKYYYAGDPNLQMKLTLPKEE